MVKRIIQLLGLLLGGMAGAEVYSIFNPSISWQGATLSIFQQSSTYYMNIAAGAIGGLIAASIFAGRIAAFLHGLVERTAALPVKQLLAGTIGLVGGLLLSVMLYPAVVHWGGPGHMVPALLALVLGYMGLRIGLLKQEEIGTVFQQLLDRKTAAPAINEGKNFEEHKILDTSVIIDGRIADICKTGFIEGTIVIPQFVLEELQHIADSSDLLKRNRGRRGLDILNKIQKELEVKVLIYEGDYEEIGEVDSKLVKLAKALQGKVVTNDFNLNKVCELQGVSVLNINDLANAVKPVVLPGEEIVVQVIKDGKEFGQGVAYLDDGTMIVVEGGREYIGMTMEVLVTSVLQTSAGRMIFAKPKLLEKAL